MGFGDRLVGAILRIRESDEQRLAEEIEGWAASRCGSPASSDG